MKDARLHYTRTDGPTPKVTHEADFVTGGTYPYLKRFNNPAYLKQGHNVRRKPGRPRGSSSQQQLTAAFREVYANTPSTVKRANVRGAQKRRMLAAVAFSKARARGARLPRK